MTLLVTLEEARVQVKLEPEDASRDAELTPILADAIGWVEDYTGQILTARDVTESVGGSGLLELRAWPIKPNAVAEVTYADASGSLISIPAARLDVSRRPARLYPAYGTSWPYLATRQGFTVKIRAGYEPDDQIPGKMRRAILMLVGAYDLDREGGDIAAKAEAAATRLCRSFKTNRL